MSRWGYSIRIDDRAREEVAALTLWRRQDLTPELWLARRTPDEPWQPGSVTVVPLDEEAAWGRIADFPRGVVSLAEVGLVGRTDSTLWQQEGSRWVPMAAADSIIAAAITEDERRLYIGGYFDQVNEQPMRGVAVFEDGVWRQLGNGLRAADDLVLADLGEGQRLYAAGFHATLEEAPGVSQWDGEAWATLAISDRSPYSMALHDADGAGPEPPQLIVGGAFAEIGGIAARNIAAFDGATWRPLADGPGVYVRKVVSHDPDGAGPAHAMVHTLTEEGVWRFADGVWESVGGAGHQFTDLLSFDPDGAGPAVPILLAAEGPEHTLVVGLLRLEADEWVVHDGDFTVWPSGGQFDAKDMRLSEVTVTRAGLPTPALAVTGSFLAAGDQPSSGLALWIDACPCAADCDGDGELTFKDFLCFQNLFAAMDSRADCDGDTAFTFFDFLCYQNAFAAGCP